MLKTTPENRIFNEYNTYLMVMEKFAGTNDPFSLFMHNLRAKRLISANLHTHTHSLSVDHVEQCIRTVMSVIKTCIVVNSIVKFVCCGRRCHMIICIMFFSCLPF